MTRDVIVACAISKHSVSLVRTGNNSKRCKIRSHPHGTIPSTRDGNTDNSGCMAARKQKNHKSQSTTASSSTNNPSRYHQCRVEALATTKSSFKRSGCLLQPRLTSPGSSRRWKLNQERRRPLPLGFASTSAPTIYCRRRSKASRSRRTFPWHQRCASGSGARFLML